MLKPEFLKKIEQLIHALTRLRESAHHPCLLLERQILRKINRWAYVYYSCPPMWLSFLKADRRKK